MARNEIIEEQSNAKSHWFVTPITEAGRKVESLFDISAGNTKKVTDSPAIGIEKFDIDVKIDEDN
jgi:hypothetical protein